MRKPTPKMLAVLRLMEEGWGLWNFAGIWLLFRGSIGRSADGRICNALETRLFIEITRNRLPLYYRVTDAGRKALET